MSELIKKIRYFLKTLKYLKSYQKNSLVYIINKNYNFKKKRQQWLYLYIKYIMIILNLN